QREVLAEHGVDVDAGADVAGRIDRADLHRAAPVGSVDLLEVLGGGRIDHRPRDRIAGDAAAEAVDAPRLLLFPPLAHEVDVGEHAAAVAAPVLPLVAHAGEQPAVLGLDLDLAADLAGERDRGVGVVDALVEPLQVEHDLRARAG